MLEQLKKDVLDIAKRAQRDGLCKHKSGNFSARDKETGYIVITPAGIDRDILDPKDMVVIDMDANVIESLAGYNPTSESLMHLKIYHTVPDAMAVAHTHSMYATSFAVLNKPLPAIVYEVATMGLSKGRVPVAPYGRPGTPALAESVVDVCQEAQCFLLEGHGAVAYDKDNIYEAFLKAAYIEELAQLYFNTLTVTQGKEPNVIPLEELTSWQYPKEINVKE